MFIEYRGKIPKVAASAFVAPTAVLIGDVEVGERASVRFSKSVMAGCSATRPRKARITYAP